jgi:anti-sigma factor RsiW
MSSNRTVDSQAADTERCGKMAGVTPGIEAEFDWLMSLALDGQLDAAEQVRFNALVASHEELAIAWRAWQWIDSEFDATPSLTPSTGFVQRFELRLAEEEKQRQQRVLLLSVSLALMALVVVFLSTAGVGAFVLLTQGQWLGEQIRALTLAYTSVNLWFTSGIDTAASVAQTPQAQIGGFLYALLMVGLIAAWVQLVRRSARLDSRSTPLQVE